MKCPVCGKPDPNMTCSGCRFIKYVGAGATTSHARRSMCGGTACAPCIINSGLTSSLCRGCADLNVRLSLVLLTGIAPETAKKHTGTWVRMPYSLGEAGPPCWAPRVSCTWFLCQFCCLLTVTPFVFSAGRSCSRCTSTCAKSCDSG